MLFRLFKYQATVMVSNEKQDKIIIVLKFIIEDKSVNCKRAPAWTHRKLYGNKPAGEGVIRYKLTVWKDQSMDG